MKNKNQGFTLIELLIVIGIIAILAAAVIITITPGERLTDARESTRAAHFAAIGNAFHITTVDIQEPTNLANIADIVTHIDCGGDTYNEWRDFDDSCADLVGMGSAPVDPQNGDEYQVRATSDGTGSQLEIYTTATESEWGGSENAITY